MKHLLIGCILLVITIYWFIALAVIAVLSGAALFVLAILGVIFKAIKAVRDALA